MNHEQIMYNIILDIELTIQLEQKLVFLGLEYFFIKL
jgi:hypothetical protein